MFTRKSTLYRLLLFPSAKYCRLPMRNQSYFVRVAVCNELQPNHGSIVSMAATKWATEAAERRTTCMVAVGYARRIGDRIRGGEPTGC